MTSGQTLLALVLFGIIMYFVSEAVHWTADQVDKTALAFVTMPVIGFIFGYIATRRRALRLTRKLFGETWAEELNKAL